jgi:hypothetical protein
LCGEHARAQLVTAADRAIEVDSCPPHIQNRPMEAVLTMGNEAEGFAIRQVLRVR